VNSRLQSIGPSVRRATGEILSLRWLRAKGIELAVPAAMVLVAWNALDQLARPVFGVPFWLCWPALGGLIFAARTVLPARTARPAGFALVSQVLALWLLYDVELWQQPRHLYDLDVYLGSATRWLDGGQPYLTSVLSAWPSDPRSDFFLYPPPLLPFFGLLTRLPDPIVAVAWGIALLAFPPLMIGLESGNVAGLTFLLFAAGARAGGTLVVDGLLKVQAGVPALWLIREHRFRALVAGCAVVLVLVALTLPLVGVDSWRAWWEGLGYRASTQAAVPAMYGYSYAALLPGPAYAALAAVLVAAALLFRGRSGLAALGLASIFASPSLWPHGFAFALPAVLMLDEGTLVWAVLGAGALGRNVWLLFAFGWAALVAPGHVPRGALHPVWAPSGRTNAAPAKLGGLDGSAEDGAHAASPAGPGPVAR
jgi:hypothetical protein